MFLGNNFCSAHLQLLQSPNQTRLVQHIERGIKYSMYNKKKIIIHYIDKVNQKETNLRVRLGNIVFIYREIDKEDISFLVAVCQNKRLIYLSINNCRNVSNL